MKLPIAFNQAIFDPFLDPQLKYFSYATLIAAGLTRPSVPFYQPFLLSNCLPLLDSSNKEPPEFVLPAGAFTNCAELTNNRSPSIEAHSPILLDLSTKKS